MPSLPSRAPASPAPAGTSAPAASGWSRADAGERERLTDRALATDAGRRLAAYFGAPGVPTDLLRTAALLRLAANEPADPNDHELWTSVDAHAEAVLRRHGITDLRARRIELTAVRRLIDGQADIDHQAGLDRSAQTRPDAAFETALERAHAQLPIDLEDPAIWFTDADRRAALARRLGLEADQREQLSCWVLAHPDAFDAADLRSWALASPTWIELAEQQLAARASNAPSASTSPPPTAADGPCTRRSHWTRSARSPHSAPPSTETSARRTSPSTQRRPC